MPNRRLTKSEIENIFKPLIGDVRSQLEKVTSGDKSLLWALRRKLAKELIYEERGTPTQRTKLKAIKRVEQNGICILCQNPLPTKGAELDRFEAMLGYTAENTRLVCHSCHIADQQRKGYA